MRFLIALTFLITATGANAAELRGIVSHVRDGDTIEVENIPIRLNGVSAPELDERLGPESKAFMHELVMGKSVLCELNGEKTYDRFVGVCFLDNKDIGISRAMVESDVRHLNQALPDQPLLPRHRL